MPPEDIDEEVPDRIKLSYEASERFMEVVDTPAPRLLDHRAYAACMTDADLAMIEEDWEQTRDCILRFLNDADHIFTTLLNELDSMRGRFL